MSGEVVRFPLERRHVATVSTVSDAAQRAVLKHVYAEAFRRVVSGEDWPEAHAAEARTILRALEGGLRALEGDSDAR